MPFVTDKLVGNFSSINLTMFTLIYVYVIRHICLHAFTPNHLILENKKQIGAEKKNTLNQLLFLWFFC